MKRKKWTEEEESTLISKYWELMQSGRLPKLKTRERKFDPIAAEVNGAHHERDPQRFPFHWTWRDVSVKIQNMRHQYVGVKQKIRLPSSPHHFNWPDGIHLWHNFLNYKHVFGDVDLDEPHQPPASSSTNVVPVFPYDDAFDASPCDVLALTLDDAPEPTAVAAAADDGGADLEEGEDGAAGSNANGGDLRGKDVVRGLKRVKKGGGSEFFELREMEEEGEESQVRKRGKAKRRTVVEAAVEEERGTERVRRELEQRRLWMEREFEERRWRMKMEEKRDEEEMEWRERMVGMQMEHEKQMMQMFAHVSHGQMQVLGLVVRLVCQFFGSGGDGLGTGMTGIPSQDPGGLVGDNDKTDGNSDAHFM